MASINIKFPYRTKFEKVLNKGNRQQVNEGFRKFCSLELDVAGELLWNLDSGKAAIDSALKYMGLECISEENVSILRNELRYQYERIHGKCFNSDKIPEKWRPAYAELVNMTNQIVANAVLWRCQLTLEMGDDIINRVLYFLNSDSENYYFGGLRQMGFDCHDADYLKPYRVYVRELLLVMRDK